MGVEDEKKLVEESVSHESLDRHGNWGVLDERDETRWQSCNS